MRPIRVTLYDAQRGHTALMTLWQAAKAELTAGRRLVLELRGETRSLAQNSLMWSCLTDLSKQVDWYGNKLEPVEWKTMLTASLRRQKSVPGIDGGFVVLGESTSQMTIAQMIEVIELAHAFGDEKGVRWAKTSLGRDWPEEVCA